MIRSPAELSTPIRLAVDRKAVVFSHILLAIVLAVHTALDPTSLRFQIILAFALSGTLIFLALFRFFDLASLNSRPRTYLVVYQIFCFLGIGFISDPATPYIVGIYIVVFLMNLYYGAKGVWITVACFGVTTLTKYFYLNATTDLTRAGTLNIFVAFFVFVSVASFFVNIQKVYDWDRSKLHDTVKDALREQKRLRVLINSMTESVLVLDKQGVIRLYNAAALALFNTNNSLSDKPLEDFVELEDEKGNKITPKELLPTDFKPVSRNDIVIRYGKEDTAALSIITTPIRSTFGQEIDEDGFIMSIQDITREKSLEEERNEFISVISHELRTPVTVAEAGISNAVLLAEKSGVDEKLTKSLKTAHDQALYLANMLNDLTTFARAEKGTIELSIEEFDPRVLLSTLCEDYHKGVESKGMTITCDVDDSTPQTMASNHLYIREILQNFITNAIKYSDKGMITLKAKGKDKGILFSVVDEGIGISTADQKKVFEKFFRTEDYRTRSTSGTGLGLYIVKKLAKILDASFELQSEVGKGSSFSLYVPNKIELMEAKKSQPMMDTMHPITDPVAPTPTDT